MSCNKEIEEMFMLHFFSCVFRRSMVQKVSQRAHLQSQRTARSNSLILILRLAYPIGIHGFVGNHLLSTLYL